MYEAMFMSEARIRKQNARNYVSDFKRWRIFAFQVL